jgi:hypothetical protein
MVAHERQRAVGRGRRRAGGAHRALARSCRRRRTSPPASPGVSETELLDTRAPNPGYRRSRAHSDRRVWLFGVRTQRNGGREWPGRGLAGPRHWR